LHVRGIDQWYCCRGLSARGNAIAGLGHLMPTTDGDTGHSVTSE
jgi:hypothetical protein